MEPINVIAERLGVDEEHLIPYGRYKAKISLEAMKGPAERMGKLVVVTGITPTPAGEGKTTTAVGLTQGLGKLGKNAVVTLREPSLGPIFGIKGGGTGGGKATVVRTTRSTFTSRATPTRWGRPTTCWLPWWTTRCSEARRGKWTPRVSGGRG